MPTSQDLVPNDLPYGERQKVSTGMELAGIPRSSSASVPPSPVAPSPPVPRQRAVGGFDALANREPPNPFGAPDGPQETTSESSLARLRESPNAMIREIANLLPEYLRG